MAKKFKAVEKDAKVESKFHTKTDVGNVEWDGEEVSAQSKTTLQDDKGTGQAVVLRFFDFTANPQTFKDHKPTAQELFNIHRRGLESIMWRDGLKPYDAVEPRLMFAKDSSHYRFIIACIPNISNVLTEKPKTLSELIK